MRPGAKNDGAGEDQQYFNRPSVKDDVQWKALVNLVIYFKIP
jgi:hypothetical protein